MAHYYCISRVVNWEFVFGDVEREQFVQFMREYEAFCGVRVLTYCILSNHFHVLVQVPERPEELPGKRGQKGSVLDIVNSSPSTFAGAGDGSDNRVCPLPDVR